MHLLHQTLPGKVYTRKGRRKMVLTASGRERLTILGALERGTHRVTSFFTDATCNAQFFIAFLKHLLVVYAAKARIIIILDNATYFHAKIVSQFVQGTAIELWFLPTSSPNLNLIERLWKFAKGKIARNQYRPTFRGLVCAAGHLLRNLQRYQAELDTLLTDRFTILKCG